MNYIVPVDFSEQSKLAAEYAASLTKVWPGSLHLVHVIERNEEETSYVHVKTLNIRKNTVFEMFHFQECIRRNFGVRTGADMAIGAFTSSVLRTATQEKSDLIIMGTQGVAGLREHLYGSNTIAMLEASHLPVLAIPQDVVFKPFSHVVYVTNFSHSELDEISSLGKIAAKFKALFSILSVNTRENGEAIENFRTAVRSRIPFAAVNFEDRQNTNGVAEGLQQYSLNYSVNLIGISAGNYELVAGITGTSSANNFHFSVDVPILFFPAN